MARGFLKANASNFKNTGAAVVTNEPFTFACWFYPINNVNIQTLMSVGDGSPTTFGYFALGFRGDQVGLQVYAFKQNNTATQSNYAQSTNPATLNAWNHACGVYSADNSLTVYLNAANSASGSTNCADPTMAMTAIGQNGGNLGPNEFFSGNIAEAGIWDVALTLAEIQSLAKGFSPKLIRPGNLALYMPLIREFTSYTGFAMTESNTTAENHARIYE